jgi:hypothetical protein
LPLFLDGWNQFRAFSENKVAFLLNVAANDSIAADPGKLIVASGSTKMV